MSRDRFQCVTLRGPKHGHCSRFCVDVSGSIWARAVHRDPVSECLCRVALWFPAARHVNHWVFAKDLLVRANTLYNCNCNTVTRAERHIGHCQRTVAAAQ